MASNSPHAITAVEDTTSFECIFASLKISGCQDVIRQVFEILKPVLEKEESSDKEVQNRVEELRTQMHSLVDLFDSSAKIGMNTYLTQKHLLLVPPESSNQVYHLQGVESVLKDYKEIAKIGQEGTVNIQRCLTQIEIGSVKNAKLGLQLNINDEITKQSRKEYAQVAVTTAGEHAADCGGRGFVSKVLGFFLKPLVKMGIKGIQDKINKEMAESQKKVENHEAAMAAVDDIGSDTSSIYKLIRQLYNWWKTFQNAITLFEDTLRKRIQNDTTAHTCSHHLSLKAMLNFMKDFSDSIKEVLCEAPSNPIICRRDLESDPTMNGQFIVFKKAVNDIPTIFTSLETSQLIVGCSHNKSFGESVQGLRDALLKHLPTIQDVLDLWVVHLDSGLTCPRDIRDCVILMDRARDTFTSDAASRLGEIDNILSNKISPLKTIPAKSKQSDETENGVEKIMGRRVARKAEGLELHQKLSKAVGIITDFSRELGLALRDHPDGNEETSSVGTKDIASSDGDLAKSAADSLQFTTDALKSFS